MRRLAVRESRRGAALIALLALLIVFLLGMVAFAVDLGYLVNVRHELQNAADSAALAGTSKLLDPSLLRGTPDETAAIASAQTEATRFANFNKAGGVSLNVLDNSDNSPTGDIVCGYLSDPVDLSQVFDMTHFPNSVQVRVRRDQLANGSLSLYFARALGVYHQDLEATATASCRDRIVGFKIQAAGATTCKLLPFALNIDTWNQVLAGDGPDLFSRDDSTGAISPGSDGIHECKLYPVSNGGSGSGDLPPGNFGTVDIGASNNSTNDIKRQILYGPNAEDLSHFPGGVCQLDPTTQTLMLQGDTGVSAGVKDELAAIIGQPRIIPLYSSVSGPGNNAQYTIVGFAGITITEVVLTGSLSSKHLTIQPCFVIDPNGISGPQAPTPSWFVYNPVALTR
jgi:Flp pilus assembly protein TadG